MLPDHGLRDMCTWEQFCRFAREPERRKIGIDARINIGGTQYELEPVMAGDFVILLCGLFDDELYAEYEGERFGPYYPVDGPIPLRRYRAFKRTKAGERADRIRLLADQLGLPIATLSGTDVRLSDAPMSAADIPRQPFDPYAHEYHYPTVIAAKLAVADELAKPLAKLVVGEKVFIDQVLA